ncbi:hypothetical protein HDU79_002254 [Rhizoclosmatium sp. JEL0117]|nr:hypothetical protein HDU79_002254 [Rhizoclosmatium sp. JEL0117]
MSLEKEKEVNVETAAPEVKANHLGRKLKARHLEMIAIGGTIGTGLLKKSGRTIASSGPLGALLVFALVGLQVFGVATGIGEMVTLIPVAGAFSTLPARFVNKPLGFATGWSYWINMALPGEISAIASLMTYWVPISTFPSWAWTPVFYLPLVAINSISVRGYGETEYFLALIKVVVISIFMIIATFVWFGATGGGFLGFKYWAPPIKGSNPLDQFVSFTGAFTTAFYSYSGTEMVGITAAEAENPRKSVPRAINGTFWRIIIFYVGSIFLVGVTLSPDSTFLLGKTIANSPFVYVYKQIGISGAADIMNAVIVLAAWSAINSGLYATSRVLYGLSEDGFAPKAFGKVDRRGVPYVGLYFTTLFAALGLVAGYAVGSEDVFNFLSGFVSVNTLLAWMAVSITHLRFRWGYIAQGRQLKDLPYVAPFFPYIDILSLAIGTFVLFCITFGALYGQDINRGWWFDNSWIYFGIPLFFSFFIGKAAYDGHQSGKGFTAALGLIPYEEMDFTTGALTLIETEDEKEEAILASHQKPKTIKEWLKYVQYKLF